MPLHCSYLDIFTGISTWKILPSHTVLTHIFHISSPPKNWNRFINAVFLPKNPKDVASISHKSPNGEVLIRDSSPARQSHQGCRCSNSGAAKWSCGATGPGAGRPLENGHIMGIQARIREKIMGSFGKLEDFPAFDGWYWMMLHHHVEMVI